MDRYPTARELVIERRPDRPTFGLRPHAAGQAARWFLDNFAGDVAYAVKANLPVSNASRSGMPAELRPKLPHTHNALDDAIEQAELFANIFEWQGRRGFAD